MANRLQRKENNAGRIIRTARQEIEELKQKLAVADEAIKAARAALPETPEETPTITARPED